MRKRADAMMDLVDALTVAGHVDFPVALSEETPFRRKFSSIFDTLRHGEIRIELLHTLFEYQPDNSEELAGCEVYGLYCTPNEREEAETLEYWGIAESPEGRPRALRAQVFVARSFGPNGNIVGSASGCSAGGYQPERQSGRRTASGRSGSAPSEAESDCSRQPVWQLHLPGSLSGGQARLCASALTQQFGVL